MAGHVRRKTPGQRIALALQLTDFARKITEAGVRMAHPGLSSREVKLHAAARSLPRDVMIRAYGWHPDGDAR